MKHLAFLVVLLAMAAVISGCGDEPPPLSIREARERDGAVSVRGRLVVSGGQALLCFRFGRLFTGDIPQPPSCEPPMLPLVGMPMGIHGGSLFEWGPAMWFERPVVVSAVAFSP